MSVQDRPSRRRIGAGAVIAVGFAILVGTALLGCVLPVAIWPGEAKLTAPVFCHGPYTDPIVVSYPVDSDGGTNITMYCVGQRGQYTEVGFLLPWLTLWALHAAIVTVLIVVITAARRISRKPVALEDGEMGSSIS
ncbi:hypothetical protein [Nocardia alni]|uniref:hypothetical protein n=1 Tax=Nocardia alni TaxID=2815723 RepID=UPI001C21B06B|nr:hypothetical protein [Nocardia alni]